MFSNNDTYQFNSFIGNGAGVAVMYSNKVSMLNNQFKENWGDAAYGLLLKEISDSYITGNTFEKNTTGIYLEGASSIKMDHNIFKNNGWAMKIQASCMDIKVSTNNFVGNTFFAKVLSSGTLTMLYGGIIIYELVKALKSGVYYEIPKNLLLHLGLDRSRLLHASTFHFHSRTVDLGNAGLRCNYGQSMKSMF